MDELVMRSLDIPTHRRSPRPRRNRTTRATYPAPSRRSIVESANSPALVLAPCPCLVQLEHTWTNGQPAPMVSTVRLRDLLGGVSLRTGIGPLIPNPMFPEDQQLDSYIRDRHVQLLHPGAELGGVESRLAGPAGLDH